MLTPQIHAHAICRVRHERAYDYDFKKKAWLYQLVSDEAVGNILTDAGRVAIHTYLYGTVAQRTAASLGVNGLGYIALTDDATVPAAGDTSLAAELSSDGLSRVAGTVTLPTGAGAITTISNQFTYTGGPPQGVQKTALFDAASGGNMAHEIAFTQRTLATNDTITVSFQITVS